MRKTLIIIGLIMTIMFAGCSNTQTPEQNNTTSENITPVACTLEYMPVCGIDNITYGNKCAANAAKVTIAFVGECEQPKITSEQLKCTKEYNPVCGVDGVTYSNKCMAGTLNLAYNGTCGADNAFKELRRCTRELMPVCGADKVTYPNKCNAGNMQIIYEGTCQEYKNTTEEPRICTMDYRPVCAQVQVQCIKAPCLPVNQTFGNACMAGKNAILYEGECKN